MDVLRDHNHSAVSIQGFLKHLRSLRYSKKSIQTYKIALNKFESFLAAHGFNRIQDVTLKDLDQYRLTLMDEGLRMASIMLYMRAVRLWFAYLEDQHEIFINPAQNLISPRMPFLLQPVPSQEEVKRLLAQPDISKATGIRDRAFLETLYSTGVRLSELVLMDIFDVDIKNKTVRISGKGKKERVVPLGKKAHQWINRYLSDVRPTFTRNRLDEPALWLGFLGKRINPLIVERTVKGYGEKINLAITPHGLRRACATHMLQNGAHPVEVQMLLGHATLKTLGRYLKVTITDMMKTHAKARPGK